MYYFITPFNSQETGSIRIAIFADDDEDGELRKNHRYCEDFEILKSVYKNSLNEGLRRNIPKNLHDPCFHVFGKNINLTEDEMKQLYEILDEIKQQNN